MMSSRFAGVVPVLLIALSVSFFTTEAPAASLFTRGDANDDSLVNISDAVCILEYLFNPEGSACASPACLDALDTNDEGKINISDAVWLLGFLFQGTDRPPEPFDTTCGADPTDDDLPCDSSGNCGAAGPTILLRVPETVELHSIWSEEWTGVAEMHEVHSTITLETAELEIDSSSDTDGVALIERIDYGPSWSEAVAIDSGRVIFEAPATYTYTQDFEMAGGTLTVILSFELVLPDDVGPTVDVSLDCDTLQACGGVESRFAREATTRSLYYSCFCRDRWRPTPSPRTSPLFVALADDTRLVIETEDCDCDARNDETINRRISGVQVDVRGVLSRLSEQRFMIYASGADSYRQEFRFVLEDPVDEIFGIDLIECPSDPAPDCRLGTAHSRAYYLDASFERIEEIVILDFNQGSSDD